MRNIIEDDQQNFVQRAEGVLSGINDATLLILKSHLLLEEAIYSILTSKCGNPEYIEKANLRFYQLLQISRALYEIPENDEQRKSKLEMFWDTSEALNTLRNRLAHDLEPKSLEPILRRLHVHEIKDGESLSDPHIFNQLSITVSTLIGFAWGLAGNAKKTKDNG